MCELVNRGHLTYIEAAMPMPSKFVRRPGTPPPVFYVPRKIRTTIQVFFDL